MRVTLFVISDLHLGGETGKDGMPGFQMCPESTQSLLARFIGGLPAPSDRDVHLVLAGDIVDFLAEREFHAFNSDADASDKLETIMKRTCKIWDALAKYVKVGGAVTLLLGNHDVELSLPKTRRKLLDRIGQGRVSLIYDNEAFSIGELLIEHGNRFDGWNAVAHGALRRVRSRLSRGLPPGDFAAMPGSSLVIDVMNPLKGDYSFIDLLKPEDAGVLPILAALGATGISEKWKLMQGYRKQRSVNYDEEYEPKDETYITKETSDEQELYELAQNVAAGGNATQVSGINLAGLRAAVTERVRKLRRTGLKTVFQSDIVRKIHGHTFKVSHEQSNYLTAAKAASKRGFKVVVFGHTHLVKRVPLKGGDGVDDGSVYLNTGTWANVIRVPKAVWDEDRKLAEKTLNLFVVDLEKDEVARWRRSLPTYARIEMDGNTVETADVYFAADDKQVTDQELEHRLQPEASA